MKEIAVNKKAHFDYFIEDSIECGVVLTGSEVKSLRLGHLSLVDSYAVIRGGEMFLLNANIPCYEKTSSFKPDEKRTRKLLLHKTEITKIENKIKNDSLTLVPLKAYFKDGFVKVEIGICKGKKLYNKKDTLKNKDIKRETERAIKNLK